MSSLIAISLLVLTFFSITNGIEIKISSDSLKSINDWDKTEPYLMGVFGRWAWDYLYKQYDYMTKINQQYGVQMLAWNKNLHDGILPKTKSEAISCCSTTAKLKAFVQSSDVCNVFGKNQIWNDEYLKTKTSIDTYLYGHDVCQSGDSPTVDHCVAADNEAGWGVPDNSDGWWNWMFIGNIGCALKLDPTLKYWHIWNEPNAVYSKHGKTGDDYAQFYFEVAKAVKGKYPQVELAGPVTWCPPVYKTVFNEWFVPLMKKVVSKGRKDLLDYIDFHAYTNADEYNPYARWDFVVTSIHVLGLYWNGLTNGGGFIRSQMTETNVALDESEVNNPDTYWNLRVIENAKQIMALSHNTDKFLLRVQFAMGKASDYNEEKGNHYGWAPYTDKYMHDIIKPIQEGYPVYFEFSDVKEGFPTYDNGNGVMAQTIYNDEDDTITVLLINYKSSNIDVTLTDKDGKVIWDTTARFTRRWGPNSKTVTKSGTKATVQLSPRSITAVTGTYRANPSTKVTEYEFGPFDETQIMKDVGYKVYDVDYTVNIYLNKIPSGLDPSYAYIKFGLGYGAITDFKWTIKVKVGSTTYLTKSNFVPTMNFTQFPIETTSFLSKITKGNTVKVQFIGIRTNYPGSYWRKAPISGRIAFASLVVGGSIKSSYIKVTSGVNIHKFYYAAKLSNIPTGIKISWIKMKSKSQTSWQLGTYNSNNKYWEWKNGPYSAPFDFQIKSTDGQIIYSWDIIDTMNDKDSGVMKQTFGAAYTEEDENVSGLTTAESIVIVIAVLVMISLIGLCICCIIRRRKMRNAVSFNEDTEDSKEKPMKIEGDNTTPKDGDDNGENKTGGYDMSPIDPTPVDSTKAGESAEEDVIPVDDI